MKTSMTIASGHQWRAVAGQFLSGSQIDAAFAEQCQIGMPKRVKVCKERSIRTGRRVRECLRRANRP